MITYRLLTEEDQPAVSLPNEAFDLFGRLKVSFNEDNWQAKEELWPQGAISQLTFPDENYQISELLAKGFVVGAFSGKDCVGLAIFSDDWLKYAYLDDLKVVAAYRGQKIAENMLAMGLKTAQQKGYAGIWTIGQDNNLGACRFYLKMGFEIGGLDTKIYRHTLQEEKANIHFYLE